MKTAVALLICFSAIVSTTHHGAQESPSPYAEGFPRTFPSLKAPKIELTPNEQGLLVRTDKSHEQATEKVKEYLQTQYLPKVREHYPDQDATSIKIVTRPTTESLDVHENPCLHALQRPHHGPRPLPRVVVLGFRNIQSRFIP